jgi:DNA-binding NtrC family response regulator
MKKPIVILGSREEESNPICNELEKLGFLPVLFSSLVSLKECAGNRASRVVLLDLDSISVDDFGLRELKRQNPELHILALSGQPYHPEIKESMSTHIFACLRKPLDREELSFFLKSIYKNDAELEGGPQS